MPDDKILIIKSNKEFAESYNKAVDTVAKEKKYLASVHGFPLESSISFIEYIYQNNLAQYFLVKNNSVIGWCDIIPKDIPEFNHIGVLGMGILAEYRGRGLGRKLLQKTIDHAKQINKLEKIELNVFENNSTAILLYKKMGFEEEGKRLNARKIDGFYQNEILMGKMI